MSRREVQLAELERKAKRLEDEIKSLISSLGSKSVSQEAYISRRAELEKEYAEITDRITRLRFVKGCRSPPNKT